LSSVPPTRARQRQSVATPEYRVEERRDKGERKQYEAAQRRLAATNARAAK